ncbi:hypothetical protein ACHAXT_007419 [Thalassiosira profunda]
MAELRKVEEELSALSAEWRALRRKRPRFEGASSGEEGDALAARMPPWKELRAKVKDEDIFPPEEEADDEGGEDTVDMEVSGSAVDAVNAEGGVDATGEKNGGGADDTAGYSEFGMCLAPSGDESKDGAPASNPSSGGSIFERYAAKSAAAAKPKVAETVSVGAEATAVDEEEEEEGTIEDANPKDVLASLESMQDRVLALAPKIDKITKKLNDRDPVTKKPRYGEKTIPRVKEVIRVYKALEQGVAFVCNDTDFGPSLMSSLRSMLQQHTERLHAQARALQSKEELEAELLAKEQREAEELVAKQRLLEEQQKRDEEAALNRKAEEARKARLEEEQRVLEAERRADQELLDLVPTKGAEGVREQIGRMREALKDDRAALDVALGSLYTLFEQIVRKPEEVNFRRVRRDHPKFVEDIGRHVGGREVLVAAGFQLQKLDGVPCFFSKEPHLESDMDGWSAWFDAMKQTLAVIEEEMIK